MRFLLTAILLVTLALPVHAGKSLTFTMPIVEPDYYAFSVLKAAYAKLDIEVHTKRLPAWRSLLEASEGKSDGEVNRIAAIESNHPNLIRIPIPINKLESMAYTCDPDITVNGWKSLARYRIGIRNGFRYAEIGTLGMPHVYKSDTWTKLFELLVSGRVDVVVAVKEASFIPSKSALGACIKTVGPPLASIPLYHYIHKRHEDLVPGITLVLKEMLENGEVQRIRAKGKKAFWEKRFKDAKLPPTASASSQQRDEEGLH